MINFCVKFVNTGTLSKGNSDSNAIFSFSTVEMHVVPAKTFYSVIFCLKLFFLLFMFALLGYVGPFKYLTECKTLFIKLSRPLEYFKKENIKVLFETILSNVWVWMITNHYSKSILKNARSFQSDRILWRKEGV